MMDNNLTREDAELIAMRGLENPGFFLKTFFPQWFSLPMPWVHRGVLALLTEQTDWLLDFGDEEWPGGGGVWTEAQLEKVVRHFVWREEPEDMASPSKPIFQLERDSKGKIQACHMGITDKMLIIMPRGISKTTLVNASNIRRICYHDTDFLVYLSETATHAEQQLENIKRELEGNGLLKAVFGEKRPDRSDPARWRQELIETTDGVVVTAKGRGGQVRGLNHRGKRPQDIVFDDVEDRESVRTEEQRDKSRTWLKSDVEPALPQIEMLGRRGRIIGLGTVLHPEGLLLSLARDPEWVTVRFGCVDPDGDMLWDHYMDKAAYEAKRKSYARLGKLADFNLEFMSSTKSEGSQTKFPSSFTYVQHKLEDFVARAIVVDPAISAKKDSDFCAFGVVGITAKGFISVIDVELYRGLTPREQVDKFFELHFLYDCTHHGVESIAYQQALIHLLKEEMFRRGKAMGPRSYFEITPITHGRTAKIERVEGVLSPRYLAGYVTHQRRFPEYETQLLDWPNGKLDGPDVVAMAVTLLDPFAALAYDPENEDQDKLAKDQFPAEDDDPDLRGWRSAP